MGRYVIRRISSSLVTIVLLVVVVFLAARVLPGDPARIRAGSDATPESIEKLREQLGLNRPIYEQFASYIGGVLHGDLGTSTRTQTSVSNELFSRLPASLELASFAFVIALVIGLGLGILAAAFRGTWVDAAVRGIAVVATSVPLFWLALLAIMLLVYAWHWFPSPIDRLPHGVAPPHTVTGFYVVDSLLTGNVVLAGTALRQLALPALVLGALNSVSILKITRAAMGESFESDFVRTARSFALPRSRILFQDGLRTALPPVITSVGMVAGHLIAGNIITEQVFSWPGIGQYLAVAIQESDFDAVQGFVLIVGIGYVVVNLIIDFLYMLADPRIQLAGRAAR